MFHVKLGGGKSGQGTIQFILLAALVIVLVLAVLPFLSTSNTASARSTLEGQGYVVLSPADYTSLLNAVNTGVSNAAAANVAAVIAANKIDLFNSSESFVYPDLTSRFCLLTANATANAFGAWTEITDNTSVTLSSKFAASSGYLGEITLRNFSVVGPPYAQYIVEITYNDGANIIGRQKVYADWTYVLLVKSQQIPMGATIKYRLMCSTGGGTCYMDVRYFHG